MPSRSEQFGNVYIPREDKSGQFELLTSTCFSNLDLKWYGLTGDIHEKFGALSGSPFSLGFNIKNLNKKRELENFKGKFQVPLKLGELKRADLDYLEELRQVEMDYAKKVKIISGDDDPRAKILETTQTGVMFLMMTPGKKYVRESPLLLHLSLLVMFDDIMDDHGTEISGLLHSLSYNKLMTLAETGVKVYKDGKKSNGLNKRELLSTVGSDLEFDEMFQLSGIYDSFVKLNQRIYEEALKLGDPLDAEPFFQSLLESYEALIFQQSHEWRQHSSSPNAQFAQAELRKITISTKMAGEVIALQRGTKVGQEIRSSCLFKWFLGLAGTHAAKVNDLMSFDKEMKEGDDFNEIYYLHVVNDWPLEKALQKVLDDANESVRCLDEAGKMLLEIHENDESLSEYIQITKEVICGHLQWFAYITRYHPLVYDCYIEGNDETSKV